MTRLTNSRPYSGSIDFVLLRCFLSIWESSPGCHFAFRTWSNWKVLVKKIQFIPCNVLSDTIKFIPSPNSRFKILHDSNKKITLIMYQTITLHSMNSYIFCVSINFLKGWKQAKKIFFKSTINQKIFLLENQYHFSLH